MRLNRASPAEVEWLGGRLSSISGPFGSWVEMAADGDLCLRWRQRGDRG
jgi:hypothetical protein